MCFSPLKIGTNIHTYLVKPYGQAYHRSSKQAGDSAVTTATARVIRFSSPPLLDHALLIVAVLPGCPSQVHLGPINPLPEKSSCMDENLT